MLDESPDLREGLGTLDPLPLTARARNALAAEDRPRTSGAVEDAKRIATILDL